MRALLFGVLLATPALAQAEDSADEADVKEGKTRFAAGSAYFKKGDYQRAMIEFQAGYALARRNGFLYNIGLCQRYLGQKQAALESFRTLIEREPNYSRRTDVERYIRELEEELGLVPATAATVEPAAPPAQVPVVVAAAPAASITEPPRRIPAPGSTLYGEVEEENEKEEEDEEEGVALLATRKAGPLRAEPAHKPTRPLLLEEHRDEPERAAPSFSNTWLWVGASVLIAGIVAVVYLSAPASTPAGSIGTIDLR